MNFCNKSGLLSSATQSQLYDISRRNGLQSTYYEFSGLGISANNNAGGYVQTLGSVLIIDPAIDLSLDTQYSNMSSGQYNITFNISLGNQSDTPNSPVISLICVNSGIFTTENGMSSFTTGLLTQEQVLNTKTKSSIIDKNTYEKEIIGGSLENVNSISKYMKHRYANIPQHIQDTEQDDAQSNPNDSNLSGSAISAGGMNQNQNVKKIHKYRRQ
jgi:hypothetical protein